MRFAIFTLLLALFAVCVLATAPQKAIIVSYPDDTPDSVLTEAKLAIKSAGGIVTHEYKLIKAFSAKVTAKVLESVQALGEHHGAVIEEDSIVTANSGA